MLMVCVFCGSSFILFKETKNWPCQLTNAVKAFSFKIKMTENFGKFWKKIKVIPRLYFI
jgi:hypothetical protein